MILYTSAHTVIFVGLLQLSYEVTEGPLLGPSTTVSVCTGIEVGSASRNISVSLVTPITGTGNNSKIQNTLIKYVHGHNYPDGCFDTNNNTDAWDMQGCEEAHL